jgi:DNA (cytosine-5)-methyltransferase 1
MRVVDLFAGCGGLSLGLTKAGLNIVAAYENWEAAINVYKNNIKDHPIYPLDLSNEELAIQSIEKFKPDLIAGGPPCQDFSSAGKRDENGSRADLTLSFCNIVIKIRPTWVLMENVDRIEKSKIFKEAKKMLFDAGYGITTTVLDASLCNVPQKRKRMFLIGRLSQPNDFLKTELLGNLSPKNKTVREFFGNKINTDFYYRHPRSYARRGIFSIDEPSPTIRGVNRPIPPNYTPHSGDATQNLNLARPLSTFERSLIQTFPDNFIWDTNKSSTEQMIGNAVPVNLAAYVGNIIKCFEQKLEEISLRAKSSTVPVQYNTGSQIRLFKEKRKPYLKNLSNRSSSTT